VLSDDQILFESFLSRHDEAVWYRTLDGLEPISHQVDHVATRIWFSFFPLALSRALRDRSETRPVFHRLRLAGTPDLRDQVDSSHWFLYGHRHWPEVKAALVETTLSRTGPRSLHLKDLITQVAGLAAVAAGVEIGEVLGITAVAFMTLQQVGMQAFQATFPERDNTSHNTGGLAQRMKLRRGNLQAGILNLLLSGKRKFRVRFDESNPSAWYQAIDGQDLTMAAAEDQRDYRSLDPRCSEGPIPVECRAGSCGSCWVGVLSGHSHLSAFSTFEGNRLRFFGYCRDPLTVPIIRLACQTVCHGPVTIVIPPWNGVIGKLYPAGD